MKSLALAVAILASSATIASAVSTTAFTVFNDATCTSAGRLVQYTMNATKPCTPLATCILLTDHKAPNATFSSMKTCTDDHRADAAKRWSDQPYLLIEHYSKKSVPECTGQVNWVFGIVADSQCAPSVSGDLSYKAVLGANDTNDLSVVLQSYENENCTGKPEEFSVSADQVDGTKCVNAFMHVLVVKPGDKSSTTSTNASSAAPASAPAPTNVAGPRFAVMATGVVMALAAVSTLGL